MSKKYFVSGGKSITCLAGLIGEHKELNAKMLGVNDDTPLKGLEKDGIVYYAEKSKLEEKTPVKDVDPAPQKTEISAEDLALIIMDLSPDQLNAQGIPNLGVLRELDSMKNHTVSVETRDAALKIIENEEKAAAEKAE